MRAKPIVRRGLANRDVDEAIEYNVREGAEQAALGFIKALEQAYTHIEHHAATGSAHVLIHKSSKPVAECAQRLSGSEHLIKPAPDGLGARFTVALAAEEASDLCNHSHMSSARYGYELNLPGLGSGRLTRYPHLVSYIERDNYIDVWRVLHGQRDVPERLSANR